jgi:hypothetical protein
VTGRRLGALVLALAAAGVSSPAAAAAAPDRQVIVILMPGRPYEDVLADMRLSDLTRSGGIGLLTTSGDAQGRTQAAVSLGAGRSADDAPEAIAFEESGDGLIVDTEPFHEAAGDAEPGLLGSALAEAGRTVAYVDLRGGGANPAMLLAMDTTGRIPRASLNAFPVLDEFPAEFLSPDAGGMVEDADLVVSHDPQLIPFALEHTTATEVLVLLVTAPPSPAMRERGDTVTPVIRWTTDSMHASGITSDTTHRDGVVSNVDVAPTVLDFLGVATPDEMLGSPIVAAGEPPTELHRRYLEWRKVVTPLGQIVLGLAILSLLVGLILIFGAWRPSRRVVRAVAVSGLFSIASLVTFVPASLLPTFTWPVVLVTVAAGGAALTWLAMRLGVRSATGPVALVAMAGMALVVVDVATGWHTGSTPLLGGSALDGERFFGLGNPYAGILLAGAVLGAAGLRRSLGVGLLVAASAFAGLPFLGADVGGCMTLAAVAGLWYGMDRWGGLDRRTLALGAVSAAVAVVFLIVTHRVLPPGETHVSRSVSEAGGIVGVIDVFWQRLLLNIRSTSEAPSSWLAVLGLPVWLWVALRSPRPFRPLLGSDAAWRRALIALALGGILGYVLNDTFGMAGITFVFLCAAVIYPSLALLWKGGGVREPAPATAPAGG